MQPISSHKLASPGILKFLRLALGPTAAMIVGLEDVDLSAGEGRIDDHTKTLWTKSGHRIEVWCRDGAFGASRSKEIDPDKPSLDKPTDFA